MTTGTAPLWLDLLTGAVIAAPVLLVVLLGLGVALWLGRRSRFAALLLGVGLLGVGLAEVSWVVGAPVLSSDAGKAGLLAASGILEWSSVVLCVAAAIVGRTTRGSPT